MGCASSTRGPAAAATCSKPATGVDVTAFLNITGQIIYSKIMEAYTQEAFVLSRLVDTVPTRLDGEKIPGITRLDAESDGIKPGMPYPSIGFWRRLHRDAVDDQVWLHRAGDQGGDSSSIARTSSCRRAAEVGELLGLNKEKRLIDLVIGNVNNYKWLGTSYNTYQASAPWVNLKTNVDAAEQTVRRHPRSHTGEPVLLQANTVLVMPAYRHTGRACVSLARGALHSHRRHEHHAGRQPAVELPA